MVVKTTVLSLCRLTWRIKATRSLSVASVGPKKRQQRGQTTPPSPIRHIELLVVAVKCRIRAPFQNAPAYVAAWSYTAHRTVPCTPADVRVRTDAPTSGVWAAHGRPGPPIKRELTPPGREQRWNLHLCCIALPDLAPDIRAPPVRSAARIQIRT